MGMNCAEDPFNMGMFYNSRCHSKWVCFQIPNTHIWASLYWSRPPPPTGTDAGYLEIIYSLKKGKGECECVCVCGGGGRKYTVTSYCLFTANLTVNIQYLLLSENVQQ